MQTSNKGIALIKHYEGFRTNAYRCPAGVWTIGYGTTAGVKPGMCVSESKAEQMLRADVAKFEATVNKSVKVALNQAQFDALVCFTYNVGPANFTSSTLLKLLNAGDYAGAAEQFGRWNKANGQVLSGLVKRRASEAYLFKTGSLDV